MVQILWIESFFYIKIQLRISLKSCIILNANELQLAMWMNGSHRGYKSENNKMDFSQEISVNSRVTCSETYGLDGFRN